MYGSLLIFLQRRPPLGQQKDKQLLEGNQHLFNHHAAEIKKTKRIRHRDNHNLKNHSPSSAASLLLLNVCSLGNIYHSASIFDKISSCRRRKRPLIQYHKKMVDKSCGAFIRPPWAHQQTSFFFLPLPKHYFSPAASSLDMSDTNFLRPFICRPLTDLYFSDMSINNSIKDTNPSSSTRLLRQNKENIKKSLYFLSNIIKENMPNFDYSINKHIPSPSNPLQQGFALVWHMPPPHQVGGTGDRRRRRKHSLFYNNLSHNVASPIPKSNNYSSREGSNPDRNFLRTDLIIRHHSSQTYNASLFILYLSRFLITFLKKNKGGKNKFRRLKNTAYKTLYRIIQDEQMLRRSKGKTKLLGIGFAFSGRVYGAKKATSFKILFGSVPFNTFNSTLDYANIMQKTRNGT